MGYLHIQLHSNRTHEKQEFKTHLNITNNKNYPFKINLLLRKDMYLSKPSIYRLLSILNIH